MVQIQNMSNQDIIECCTNDNVLMQPRTNSAPLPVQYRRS